MKRFIRQIFESKSGVSSKRIFGSIGWVSCIIAAGYCTYKCEQAPVIVSEILYCSATLLGLDSITGIWSKRVNDSSNGTNSKPN